MLNNVSRYSSLKNTYIVETACPQYNKYNVNISPQFTGLVFNSVPIFILTKISGYYGGRAFLFQIIYVFGKTEKKKPEQD